MKKKIKTVIVTADIKFDVWIDVTFNGWKKVLGFVYVGDFEAGHYSEREQYEFPISDFGFDHAVISQKYADGKKDEMDADIASVEKAMVEKLEQEKC